MSSGGTLAGVRDHPRACGENLDEFLPCKTVRGSPPRVRGKRAKTYGDTHEQGITPARAGKTRAGLCRSAPSWDHPRACGENAPLMREKPAQRGSPPRVRGKLLDKEKAFQFLRITPARAGKTWT